MDREHLLSKGALGLAALGLASHTTSADAAMTDLTELESLATAISDRSPAIKKYALEQVRVTKLHEARLTLLESGITQPTLSGVAVAAPVGPFTTLDGGGTQSAGIFSRDVGSPVIANQHVQRYTGYGVGQMAWPAVASTGTSDLHDLIVEDIAAVPPRSMNGTGEAGFWFGQRTHAYRLLAKRCAWMGMWTGSKCDSSLIEDFELLEMPHIGLYVEHVTTNTRFNRFRIHSVDSAVNVEWWYGGSGSHDLVFENFDLTSTNGWGFFLDAGTYNVTIRNGKLSGLNGITYPDPAHRADPNGYISIDWASIDTTGLAGVREEVHQRAIG